MNVCGFSSPPHPWPDDSCKSRWSKFVREITKSIQTTVRRCAHFCGIFFGKRFSSDVTGDGPKKIKLSRPVVTQRIKAKQGMKEKHRKASPSSSNAKSSKTTGRANQTRKGEKIAPESISEHRLDLAPGIVDNIAADSQAGIHGRRCHAGNVDDIFQGGLTKARLPLIISGVVGGEVRLSFNGTASYNFTLADDSKQTAQYQVSDTWAVPSNVGSWDTSIISLAQLLNQHPCNALVTIPRDPNAPYGIASGSNAGLGIQLYSPDGTMFTTRIHELDKRWWLSGRAKRKLKSQAKTNHLRSKPLGKTENRKVTTLLGTTGDGDDTHIAAVSFNGSVNSVLTKLDRSRRKSRERSDSSKTKAPKISQRNRADSTATSEKKCKRSVHVVTTRSKQKNVLVKPRTRAKGARKASDETELTTVPISKPRTKKAKSTIPDKPCVTSDTPKTPKSVTRVKVPKINKWRRKDNEETKERTGDAQAKIVKGSRPRRIAIEGLGKTTFHAAPLWKALDHYHQARRIVMIVHGHCGSSRKCLNSTADMYSRFPKAAKRAVSSRRRKFQAWGHSDDYFRTRCEKKIPRHTAIPNITSFGF